MLAASVGNQPAYRSVTQHRPVDRSGMPGPYPGRVVSVHADRSIDERTAKPDPAVIREMIAKGITTLTGGVIARWEEIGR